MRGQSHYLNQSTAKLSSGQRKYEISEIDSSDQILFVGAQHADHRVTLVVTNHSPQAQNLKQEKPVLKTKEILEMCKIRGHSIIRFTLRRG